MKLIKLAGVGIVTALLCACGSSGSSGESGSAKVAQMRLGPSLEKAAQQPQLLNDYPCSTADSRKVMLCHVPPGNPDAKHTICVGRPALNAHLREHNRS